MSITLSGGDLGGEVVDADGWADGETRTFAGLIYRRAGEVAVFVGVE